MNKKQFFLKTTLFILLFIIIGLPFIPLVLSSLSFGWQWPSVLPESFSFRAWEYVLFGSSGTWQAVWMSLLIAFIVTAVNILLAVPASIALVRHQFRAKWLWEAILFAPIVIPPFVAVMGIRSEERRVGKECMCRGAAHGHQ